jgi:hypothetical protein
MRLRLLPNYYIRQSSRYKAFDFGNKKWSNSYITLLRKDSEAYREAALSR